MTLANNYNPTRQLANGISTSFSFTYDMINSDYATVYQEIDGVQTIVDSSLYTVEFDTNGGNVIFKTAPAAGTYIVIGRDVPLDQIVPYRTSSGFPANRVEENLDKLTGITQQLSNESDRSPKIPIGYQNINMNLPAPSAGKALVWNENANAIVNSTDEFNDIVTDATAQANIATQKASEAANSASAALGSQNAAAGSASAADTSASNAASSAAEALASQNAAAASENLAQQWAIKTDGMVNNEDYSAKYYASQSQASATASANSASAALSSQTAAANSASAAATSETNAATSETNAASSASAALNSQNAAATSAGLAQDWATKTDGTVDGEDYSAKYYALQAQSGLPVGTILPWSTDTAPGGFLLCDGSAVSRTTYAGLFAVIGTTFGSGDGNTTFNLPDGKPIWGYTASVIGNGRCIGLTNGNGEFAGVLQDPINAAGVIIAKDAYGKTLPGNVSSGGTIKGNLGLSTSSTNSGITSELPTISSINYIIKY